MTLELSLLAWSVVLGLVQLMLASAAKTKAAGFKWAMGPRDEDPADEVSPLADRLRRAQNNFMETFPFFATAVLMATVLQSNGFLTALGCQLYFWARLVYVPLYAVGVPVLRTLVWGVSMAGILLVLAATLPI
jgi:uncharacterized MAPEG superfamily protein